MNIQQIKKIYIVLALAIVGVVIAFSVSQPNEIPKIKTSTKDGLDVKNVDCEIYFSKNANANSASGNPYISPKAIGFMSKDQKYGGVFRLVYNDNAIHMISKIASSTAICVNENPLIGIKFDGEETIYMEEGRNKLNCIPGRSVNKDEMATAIHKIPINSLMFKHLITKDVIAIGIDTDKDDFALFPLDDQSRDMFKDLFKCAYLSVGRHIDLSDESLLIDNGHKPE